MKFELLIFVIFILLFYLFKKNKFYGGREITQKQIDEYYNEFIKPYENALSLYNGLLDKYKNKNTPDICKNYFSKYSDGGLDLEESLDTIRNNINDMKNRYDKVFNSYIKLFKLSKLSKDDKGDKDNIDLTKCSHNIITTFIYSPKINSYLHSNSTQNGNDYDGFSYGGKNDEIAWTIEFCGKNINNDTVVHIKSTFYNKYWMSDSLKGEGFKWNENRDINKAWHLIQIDENKFKLQSIYLKNMNIKENCLSNNIAEGSKFSWSYEKEEDRYIEWNLETINIHT